MGIGQYIYKQVTNEQEVIWMKRNLLVPLLSLKHYLYPDLFNLMSAYIIYNHLSTEPG